MREDNFNLLRIFAGIGVLMGHLSWHMGIPAFGYDAGTKPFWHLGVPFFFFLTGLLIYPSFSKMMNKGESIYRFFLKRYYRIAPSIYFITFFTVAILFVIGAIQIEVFKEVGFLAWIVSLIILIPLYNPDVFSHIGIGVINGSLWTIFTQIGFFFTVPIIFYFDKKFGFRKMITVLLVISVLFFIGKWIIDVFGNEHIIGKFYQRSVVANMLYFSIGIFWSKAWKSTPKSIWVFLISLILLYVFKSDVFEIRQYVGELQNLLWIFPMSYATLWFGYMGPKFLHGFNKFEDIGMGIYIWHMLVINIFLYLGLGEVGWLNNWLMYVLVIAITVALAYLSRILIEKPSLVLLDRGRRGSEVKVNA